MRATEAGVAAVQSVRDAIAPFPGGIVRSGSKVGSKYKGMGASTNDAYCPTLRGVTQSALDEDIGCVLEIVIDGLTDAAVSAAMRAGLKAIIDMGPEAGRETYWRRKLWRQTWTIPLSFEGIVAVKPFTLKASSRTPAAC